MINKKATNERMKRRKKEAWKNFHLFIKIKNQPCLNRGSYHGACVHDLIIGNFHCVDLHRPIKHILLSLLDVFHHVCSTINLSIYLFIYFSLFALSVHILQFFLRTCCCLLKILWIQTACATCCYMLIFNLLLKINIVQ